MPQRSSPSRLLRYCLPGRSRQGSHEGRSRKRLILRERAHASIAPLDGEIGVRPFLHILPDASLQRALRAARPLQQTAIPPQPLRAMAKDIPAAVREICLSFPESEEYVSHGSPNFRVRGGKTYASFALNHHGDGRVALWLGSPPGAQEQHVRDEPEYFFVPPYVGPRGWLGVELDKGLDWKRVAGLVRDAYEKVAPAALSKQIGKTIVIVPPKAQMSPEERDPMLASAVQKLVEPLREFCLSLPEVVEDPRFGAPSWQAGKRTFAMAYRYDETLTFGFWVGVEQQGLYTGDKRYSIPPYMGHNGWIALRVGAKPNWKEIRGLALHSYRHFALKRMLAKLGAG